MEPGIYFREIQGGNSQAIMKILQLIDTLHPGGGERMALNYFQALKRRSITSVLVVTREKGLWGEEISQDPEFYFLDKKNTFDIKALWRFKQILKDYDINIVHAHGTSWFFAVLCKLSGSNFKLIWHDHYGNSEFLDRRPVQPLKTFSRYFEGIISVNNRLKDWAQDKLQFKKEIIFLLNFVLEEKTEKAVLKGDAEIKLISVANLRIQKDHLNLLKAFDSLQEKYSISLHLIGRDFGDSYSLKLRKEFDRREGVYFYGEVSSAIPYLKAADIGVLSSRSEGLPVALIEYGLAGLAVVSTDVGEIKNITKETAKLVRPENVEDLEKAIGYYIQNEEARKKDAIALHERINELYSETEVIEKYLNFIKNT